MLTAVVSPFFRPPIIFGALTICAAIAGGSSATASEQRYTYRVHLAAYGDIGVYRSAVDDAGPTRTITTEAHLKVSVLGIAVYAQDLARIERQVGNRLVYFRGVTVENGKSIE